MFCNLNHWAYSFAHFLRDRCPFLWDLVEQFNSCLFHLRYGKSLESIHHRVLAYTVSDRYSICQLSEIPAHRLVSFFSHQPHEAFRYFHPHGFDEKSICKLQCNKAFLGYVLLDGEEIAGYFFIRSFFHGKGFRGRMVGMAYRGCGLGTRMNQLMNEIGFGIGLRLYETVSKENIASYRSALSASKVTVVKEMADNELFLEIVNEG